MKKKVFALIVIIFVIFLCGCTNQKKENSNQYLVGKWEIDYEACGGVLNDTISNFEFIDDTNIVMIFYKNGNPDIVTNKGTYSVEDNYIKARFDSGSSIDFKLDKMNEESISLDSVILKKVSEFSKTTILKNDESIQSEYIFTAGNYEVAVDIPPGKYDVEWVSGNGNCVAGDMIEMFGEGEYRIKEYKNLTLLKSDAIKVSGTLEIKFVSKEIKFVSN